ncbi:T9SS type A sorting domain-containing protein [Flavobacterium sp.]|uniref:DUF7619 domain-containing protein n=1 Tax=Flavobacterium sp. TaxID=239 RepID=UPI0031CEB02B
MIKIYLFFFIALSVFSSKAQVLNFSDSKFKEKLLQSDGFNAIAKDENQTSIKIDGNDDGIIEESEAMRVFLLNLENSNITSLEGIENFPNLHTISCGGNQISNLDVSNLKNLKSLNCYNNQIASLNLSGLMKLTFLNCNKNKLTGLNFDDLESIVDVFCSENELSLIDVKHPENLRNLFCSNNKIETLDLTNYLNLAGLECSNNKISVLDVSHLLKLEGLYCSNNAISILEISNLTKLQRLYCYFNNLTFLDFTNLLNIEEIAASNNQISTINLKNLRYLKRLEIGTNKLTTLDLTGSTSILETLAINNNSFENLVLDSSKLNNVLNFNFSFSGNVKIDISALKKLKTLFCNGLNLETINVNELSNLEALECGENKLTSLDISKLYDLRTLRCHQNDLTVINFGEIKNLQGIDCSNNPFVSADFSSLPKLINLIINNNRFLESLFLKNGSTESVLNISGNPSLKYICSDDNQIIRIQNLVRQNNYKNCNVNSYCSFVPGGESFLIQGNAKIDFDKNGCDINDSPGSQIRLKISDGTKDGIIFTDDKGNYSAALSAGRYTILPILENSDCFSVYPNSVDFEFTNSFGGLTQDFCLMPNVTRKDLEVSLIPVEAARPGFDAKYKIILKNKGNGTESGVVNLNFRDDVLDFISAFPVFSSQNSGSLSWNFSDLKPFESKEIELTLNVNSPMETPAINNDDILEYKVYIDTPEDENLLDNVFTLKQTVVGSYDPNDKTCLEGKVIKPELIGQYVHYLIRFENTGTYNAENVVIKDIIDTSKFDVSTLVPTSSSHSYITKISEGNKVEFIFEKINLPFDDANNDGYIAFKIKTLPTLVVGDSFENEANIYFDYNFPILTNKETSTFKTLGTQDFEFSSSFSVYPNPVQNYLQIDSKDLIEIESVYVYNVLGQLIQVIPDAHNISKIDVSKFKSGNYILQVKTATGNLSTKFIKI